MKESNRLFLINNWKYFVIYGMLGLVMYWTAIVVQPTLDLQKGQQAQQEFNNNLTEQNLALNEQILQNQNRNSNLTVMAVNQTAALRAESIAQFNQVLDRIDQQIDRQTLLIAELIQAHANVTDNQSKALYTVINNTYAEVIPAINSSMMEHRLHTETSIPLATKQASKPLFFISIGNESPVGNITAAQKSIGQLLSNDTKSQQQLSQLLNSLTQQQAGTISSSGGAEPLPINQSQLLNATE